MAPPLPWRSNTAVDPAGTYVVTMTRLPLRRHTRIPSVMRATWQIVRLLARGDGLVGYSLKADLIRKTFWTVSAWESTDALHAFVRSDVHVRAMTGIGPHMNEPRIETTLITGPDLPPSWSEIRRHLTDSPRHEAEHDASDQAERTPAMQPPARWPRHLSQTTTPPSAQPPTLPVDHRRP